MPAFNPTRIVQTDDDPIELGIGLEDQPPVGLQVKAKGGLVTIEVYDFDTESWVLPEGPDNSIVADADVQISRANRPPLRITASGGAMLAFFGEIR